MAMRKVTTRTNAGKAAKAKPKAKAQTKAAQKAKQRPKAKPQAQSLFAAIKNMNLDTRRPPSTPSMPPTLINELIIDLTTLKEVFENYAEHLRSLDRKRLNGVGIKHQGFIDRALLLAKENPEFMPHYVTLQKFQNDDDYFTGLRTMYDLSKQISELLWNMTIIASDIVYTDALEFYASVREAAKRRVDAAETIFNSLSPFFKKMGKKTEEEPTMKKVNRDIHALQRGTKSGVVKIVNIKPKLTGGKHEVIDETFKDTAEFKETEEGQIGE